MFNIISSSIKTLSCAILDFVFPPRCFGCDKDIDKGLVCDKCFAQITTNALGTCPICGLPKSSEDECNHLILLTGLNPRSLSRVRALGKYKPPYKGLVHNFKYQHKTKISKILGLGLANLINSDPILSRARYIVPIPLHPARLRERGFNQSLLLAQEASFGSGISLLDCLARKKNTKSQTQFDYKLRMENIRDAYQMKSGFNALLKEQRVILVDDVITTGATLTEAAKVLKENGVSDVYGIVVTAAQN